MKAHIYLWQGNCLCNIVFPLPLRCIEFTTYLNSWNDILQSMRHWRSLSPIQLMQSSTCQISLKKRMDIGYTHLWMFFQGISYVRYYQWNARLISFHPLEIALDILQFGKDVRIATKLHFWEHCEGNISSSPNDQTLLRIKSGEWGMWQLKWLDFFAPWRQFALVPVLYVRFFRLHSCLTVLISAFSIIKIPTMKSEIIYQVGVPETTSCTHP